MANETAAGDVEGLPEYCKAGVLVLGCGNPLMGDDGFGPAVAENLLAGPILAGICVINAGTGSRGIIFNMVTGPCRPKAILIVDALEAGKPPGELFWVDIESLSLEKAEDFSLHMTPASNMLLQLKQMGVEIRVLACEPRDLPEMMTEGLSPGVAAAVGPAARMVLRAADEILKTA